jgi:hypothetical protein
MLGMARSPRAALALAALASGAPGVAGAAVSGVHNVAQLALDSEHVYAAYFGPGATCAAGENLGGVVRWPRSGGPAEALASGVTCPHAIAVDDAFVYWGYWASGEIWRVAR